MLYTTQTEKLYSDENDSDSENRHRVIDLPSGNKVHMRAHDPYGFVRINFDKGPTPELLSGEYTSYMEAERAIQSFLNEKEQRMQIALENQRPKKIKLTPRIGNDNQADAS